MPIYYEEELDLFYSKKFNLEKRATEILDTS